jgi:hypothetical protein
MMHKEQDANKEKRETSFRHTMQAFVSCRLLMQIATFEESIA